MKIGIDLDDTINNLVDVWLGYYNLEYNDNLTIKDIKSWDIDKYVKCGMDIYKYLGNEELFKVLSIKDNAANIIEKIIEKHEVYIVTANASYNFGVCDDKIAFIKKFLPFFPVKNVIFINNKSLLDLDILIDDGLHNFKEFKGIRILFNRPWTENADGYDYKIVEWNDYILKIIDKEWKKNLLIEKIKVN